MFEIFTPQNQLLKLFFRICRVIYHLENSFSRDLNEIDEIKSFFIVEKDRFAIISPNFERVVVGFIKGKNFVQALKNFV